VVCFANLKSFPPIYHAVGKLNYPLFDSKWAALEEILLFTAIEKYVVLNEDVVMEIGVRSKNKWAALKILSSLNHTMSYSLVNLTSLIL
jgi:hypothetical protein